MIKRTQKCKKLLDKIRDCVMNGKYFDSYHSLLRRGERKITRPEILQVLKRGWHERKKDQFDTHHENWKYAIRGETVDGRKIRVVISFQDDFLVILTAIVIGALK